MAGSLSKFVEYMRVACEDWSVGYDQSNRWDIRDNGEADCSSLTIRALQETGFDTGSASYTGDLSANLTKRGWKRLPPDISTCRPGDILLNDTYHVCVVISGNGWGAKVAQASIDENGRASGGRAGDQTGYETNVKPVYVYSRGWDCILRYDGPDSGDPDPWIDDGALDVDGYLGPLSVREWQAQLGTEQDGVVTGQREEYREIYPRLTSVDDFDGSGSSLMKAVQSKVGVPNPTGVIARGTVSMIQGWLTLHGYDVGTDIAGYLGDGTAKAIQRSLNNGEWS